MGSVISILNEKGGVGKSTSAVELASLFANEYKRSVVVVDLDGQSNSSTLLLGKEIHRPTVSDIFFKTESMQLGDALRPALQSWGKIDVLPADGRMSRADREIASQIRADNILRNALKRVVELTDIVLIDLPPAINFVSINALSMSTHYLMPASVGQFALTGVSHVLNLVREMQEAELCKTLQCLGIVVTAFQKGGAYFTREFLDELNAALPENHLAHIRIPHSIKLQEAHAKHQPITTYDPTNSTSEAYKLLAKTIIERISQ